MASGQLAALAVSALSWRVLVGIHGARFGEYAAECAAILEGRAFSPAFQNRLLAPALLWVLGKAGVRGEDQAFGWLLFAALAAAHGIVFEIQRRARGTARAFQWMALNAALFLALVDFDWLKAWDGLDFLFFQLLALEILGDFKTPGLVLLFGLAVWNRESALYIPLWMGLSAVAWVRRSTAHPLRRAEPGRLGLALGLGFIGVALTTGLRHLLWKGVERPLEHVVATGNHFMLWENLAWVGRELDHPNSSLVVPGVILAAYCHAHVVLWAASSRAVAVLLLLDAMALGNLLFAQVGETRVWLICAPVWLAGLSLRDRRGAVPGAMLPDGEVPLA